jgi:glycosyltransferase involved in cell wall biosynthesis
LGNLLLTVIVPVYNEHGAISSFLERVRKVEFANTEVSLRVLFVDDGSNDGTFEIIQREAQEDSRISCVVLSRNFGKEAAMMAGLRAAEGDFFVPMDVDLQDPPELIPAMLHGALEGADIVLARRASRNSDSFVYRGFARFFRRIFRENSGMTLAADVGDYVLFGRKARDAIRGIQESTLYMKGLTQWVGFRRAFVDYDRPPRMQGKSKFGFARLYNLAIDGLVSFSPVPIRVFLVPGALLSFGALVYGGYIALETLITGSALPGYPSLIVAILVLGGLQLLILGVLGEYISQILREVKRRPQYIIKSVFNSGGDAPLSVENDPDGSH